MSLDNNIPNEHIRYQEITSPDKVTVHISQKAYAQIAYLIQRIHDVEWSAILLYTSNGHITNPKELLCTIDSVYLMDKGTGVSTSHEYDNEDMVKMFGDYPEYLNMRMGHVHSHNNMKSYFSSVDMQELHTNTPNHAYYLSLVVNNEGSFVAKLCYMAKRKAKLGIMSKAGKWIWSNNKSSEEEVLVVHDCNVKTIFEGAKKFSERCTEVIDRAAKKYTSIPIDNKGSFKKDPYSAWNFNNSIHTKHNYGGYLSKTYPEEGRISIQHKEFSHDIPYRTRLAKMLVTCDMEESDKPLMELCKIAEKTFDGFTDDDIVSSYTIFFTETSPEFLIEIYKSIYNMSPEEDIDKYIAEIEAAMVLIPERIGDCIAEALDNILTEIELTK